MSTPSTPLPLTRREAVRVLGGIMAYTLGSPDGAAAQGRGLFLVLDGMDPAVTVVLRGQRVSITAQELFDALKR